MVVDKLNVNYSGHQINAEPISVPENSPYKARTVHNRILKEEPSTIEIWQYSDKSGSWLTEEPYTGTVSSTGKFQVDYDGAEDGDMKFRNTILFHAAQANTEWFIWYKSVGDIYDADDFNAKVNKTTGTENNFAALDNAGGIKDSGKKADDFEPKIDPKGTAFNKNFGNATGTVCEGNDSRLSDARPPTAHKDSHITGGDDIIPNAVSGGNSGLMTGADKQNLDDAVTKKHEQNTDVGTNSETFQIGISGPRLKKETDALGIRNANDDAYQNIRPNNIYPLGSNTPLFTTQDLEYWVDGTNGSDDNDGSQEHPFATINKALSSIPQVVNHEVEIIIIYETYAESINLTGFSGKGSITIYGDNSDVVDIRIENNTLPIELESFNLTGTDDAVIASNNPGYIYLYNIECTSSAGYKDGFSINNCPAVLIEDCEISNHFCGIYSKSSVVHSFHNNGSSNQYGLCAESGIIYKEDIQPSGTTSNEETVNGGQILSSRLAERDSDAVAGNLAEFDSSGNPVDSGIASNAVPIATTQSLTFYVNPSTGNDNNNGSSGSPFKTIAKAISLIPQIVNHAVRIYLADGNYSEGITLTGYVGSGNIIITGNTSNPENVVLSGQIKIETSAAYHYLLGLKTTYTGGAGIYCIRVYGTARFADIICDTTSNDYAGFEILYSPVVLITSSTISNRKQGIYGNNDSHILSLVNGGSNNETGLQAFGSVIMKGGTQPGGTTAESVANGGVIR